MSKSKQKKTLAGTLRPDRLRKPPALDRLDDLPPAPTDLSEAASDAWSQIGLLAVHLGTLTVYDVPLLELTARTLGSVAELEAVVRTEGVIVTSGSTRKAHPALAAADRARLLAHKLLSELGLTPAGRERISFDPAKSDDEDSFDDF